MHPSRARIVLDVDLDREPIRGQLSAGDGPRRPFSGWLQLAAAVEAALAAARDRSADTASGPRSPAPGAAVRAPRPPIS